MPGPPSPHFMEHIFLVCRDSTAFACPSSLTNLRCAHRYSLASFLKTFSTSYSHGDFLLDDTKELAEAFTVLQVFENLIVVLQMVEASRTPPLTAGLELLIAGRPPEASSSIGTMSSFYTKTEAGVAWLCMQREVQKLLTELLQSAHMQSTMKELQSGGSLQD